MTLIISEEAADGEEIVKLVNICFLALGTRHINCVKVIACLGRSVKCIHCEKTINYFTHVIIAQCRAVQVSLFLIS